MKLHESDIRTKEVLDWKGVHLIHFQMSSCSQKTRIFLNLKGIDWQSHHMNLAKQRNYDDWFLGINPRGLVPVLVHDGEVHIESNDILTYLDENFPEPKLIPTELHNEIQQGLREEDDMHVDIRTLTMRFLAPDRLVRKAPQQLANYESDDGTIQGASDSHKSAELSFWKQFADEGITDEMANESAHNFYRVFERFENRLSESEYLCGAELTLLDVAWFIYTHRLFSAGYPFAELHPRVFGWYQKLASQPAFAKEVQVAFPTSAAFAGMRMWQRVTGQQMTDVVRFNSF